MFQLPPHIRALIFDCDGTLVDSIPNHLGAWMDALKHFGLSATRQEILSGAGMPTAEKFAGLAKQHGWRVAALDFAKVKDAFYQERRWRVSLIPETVEIVHAYHDVYPLAVISGGSRENVLHALDSVAITQCFDLIITASDGLPSKASPHVFNHVASYFNVAPQNCIVFEDGELALESARAAGMIGVHVDSLRAP